LGVKRADGSFSPCITDTANYFVSEASVYRLLKTHDLITSPGYIIMKAADEFKNKTTASNQLWQMDFTYLKVTGWGWFYLSPVLDDFSRFIIEKLSRHMTSEPCDNKRSHKWEPRKLEPPVTKIRC
jgi:transposase InsO family protein